MSPRWLSVYSVKEYAFCPRAGVLAANEQKRDDGADDSFVVPRLTFSPCFSLIEIEKQQQEIKDDLVVLFYGSLGSLLVALLLFCLGFFFWPLVLLACFSPILIGLIVMLQRRSQLNAERKAFRESGIIELERLPYEEQDFNWWGLIKAGWKTRVYSKEEEISNKRLSLSGKPALVLWKANEFIPVVVRRQELVEPQFNHTVRLALYADIIGGIVQKSGDRDGKMGVGNVAGVAEGSTCKWGILLSVKTKTGYLIPIDNENRMKARRVLENFRNDLLGEKKFEVPPQTRCNKCPWGRPTTEPPTAQIEPVDARYEISTKGRKFRSPCGDKYEWVPPHSSSIKLRLTSGEEPS